MLCFADLCLVCLTTELFVFVWLFCDSGLSSVFYFDLMVWISTLLLGLRVVTYIVVFGVMDFGWF